MSAPSDQAAIAARAQALFARRRAAPETEPERSSDDGSVSLRANGANTEIIEDSARDALVITPAIPFADLLSGVLDLGGSEAELHAMLQATDASIARTEVTPEGYVRTHHDGRVTRVPHGFIAVGVASAAPDAVQPEQPTGCPCCGRARACGLCNPSLRVSERLYCHCGADHAVTEHDAHCPVHPSRFGASPPVALPRYREDTRWVVKAVHVENGADGVERERKEWEQVPTRVRIEEALIESAERAARPRGPAVKPAPATPGAPAPRVRPQLSLVANEPVRRPSSATPATPEDPSAMPSSSPISLPSDVIVFDTETTGIQRDARLVELAAVRVRLSDWAVLSEFVRLIRPDIPIPAQASAVHGIRDRDVANEQPASAVLELFLAWAALPDPAPWIAHNAAFDAARVQFELSRAPTLPCPRQRIHCTLKMARTVWPAGSGLLEMPNHKLGTLVQRLHITARPTHRALTDVYATIGVLRKAIEARPDLAARGLVGLCGEGVWL